MAVRMVIKILRPRRKDKSQIRKARRKARVQKGEISSNWTSGGVNERQVVRVGDAGDWDNRRRSATGEPVRSGVQSAKAERQKSLKTVVLLKGTNWV